MIFTSTISLILALAPTTLFAAPTQTIDSIANIFPRQDLPASVLLELKKTNSLCDLSRVVLPVGKSSILPNYNNINANKYKHPHLSPQ